MAIVRFAAVLVLALWIGGLFALGGFAAPNIFTVLELHDPVAGRTVAGDVFGAILEPFLRFGVGCGLVFALTLAARVWVGPPPRWLAVQGLLLAVMLAVTLVTSQYLAPRIDVLRTTTPSTMASLPDTDPRKQEFGRLHGLSNVLLLVTVAGGLALLWIDRQDTRR